MSFRQPEATDSSLSSETLPSPVLVRAALSRGRRTLARGSARDAAREALFLLAGVLNEVPGSLALEPERRLSDAELAEYESRLARRLAGEPLQYIEGRAAFRELWLRVDGSVLIPRPETEQLVQCVLDWCRGKEALSGLDLGTGSGAIAVSLALEGPFERVVAVDISAAALKVAGINATEAGQGDQVELRYGSLFGALEPAERFDVIVSNPPYIAAAESDTLPAEVRDWEPELALYAGPTGLEMIEQIVEAAPRYLRAGGLLAIEIAPGLADATRAAVRRAGCYGGDRLRRDLSGSKRIVLAERH
jgi:release factor glutamine methyltransferase